jgi:hypothetical protein
MVRKKPSSRENGRHSKGPITQEGKDRASYNATGHGLASSKVVVLKCESQEMFDEQLRRYRNRFQPLDSPEEDLVFALAANRWRFVRLQAIQKTKIDELMYPDGGERMSVHLPDTLTNSAHALTFDQLQRYETRLEMNYQRTLRNLAFLRKEFPIAEGPPIELAPPATEEKPATVEPPAPAETPADAVETRVGQAVPPVSLSDTVEPQSVKIPPGRWPGAA